MTNDFQPADTARFEAAIRRFDEENAKDPNRDPGPAGGPYELVYARRLTQWVLRLAPDASEPLRLAARCQHICRWGIPRASYPATRAGYLKWRADLKQFHAEKAGDILRELGYPETTVARVQSLNLKRNFPNDPEGRVLEDALCLVFLEHQFADLAAKSTDEKMINALRKSWQKMTPAAQALALKLPYGPRERAFLQRALHPEPPARAPRASNSAAAAEGEACSGL
ncbi:MAG TPA: DUF4202 domain-containing protein [Candidatus Acidoferrum sp.]|nr:DUF4202 domain-containing protein [Candidatus Acidoferrum sp.]